jgi:hypothetical protein
VKEKFTEQDQHPSVIKRKKGIELLRQWRTANGIRSENFSYEDAGKGIVKTCREGKRFERMTGCKVLSIERYNVAQRTFLDFRQVRFMATSIILSVVINGAMAGIQLMFRRMQFRLGVKKLVETLDLNVSRQVQKQ